MGDLLAIARRARSLTQAQLGEMVNVSQVAINRYEAGERQPDAATVAALAGALGVTEELLRHGDRFRGALGVEAHMRRQKSTKTSQWRRVEALLNLTRVHASFLFEDVSIDAEHRLPTFDPEYTRPEDAARMVCAQWRLPMGPVTNLTRWLESAGCLVVEKDFGTQRIDGASQWVSDHPVILVNQSAPTDRKRLTLAHELGHLALHTDDPHEEMEAQANAFAAEFLMPEGEIRPEVRHLELGTLVDLKREWGVSMQALLERAYRMGQVSAAQRASILKALNARGWKTQEPGSSSLPAEHPQLQKHIGEALTAKGLSDVEIARLAGYANPGDCLFRPSGSHLRAV
ncbi:Zn-dependent peptidase ImmA, M78 family [Actinopolymorpha cephalotaxi]|uniref:Zn-dependent peptidase ImmA (M78 family)/DNA-binding XRE family transcriptional regulator n=1 Tax=Actinopolymorpha cephalotaxi TaxID=504797 RepID=A0A1I2S6Z6_9ACTN|nr:Zn-dependent peptidase ImmA (M78 family)/DNA-binding XRE family transcriptional regulator [Actinopolymorpha cephalotaxi]SFG48588.1 Zn-dependent peptidase ImmA, M78 family [Actinopolymorpha cephalotaxi]